MKSLKQKCLVASTLVLFSLAVNAAEDGQAASAAVVKPIVSSESKPKAEGDNIRWEKKYVNVPEGQWTGPRLADGQPDVQGHWSNTVSNHANFTDPQGGIPGDPQGRPPKGTRADRAPSRVSDPADGEIPYQPWARAKQQEFLQYFFNAIKPEYIEPLARCAPAGVPKSFYWHGYEIRQYPGYVVFLFSSGTRVIHLDGKPHLPENIKLWNADSRGHWVITDCP